MAAGAFVTGQSVTALHIRQTLTRGLGSLRGSAEHAGLRTGPVGAWVYANQRTLRIGSAGHGEIDHRLVHRSG